MAQQRNRRQGFSCPAVTMGLFPPLTCLSLIMPNPIFFCFTEVSQLIYCVDLYVSCCVFASSLLYFLQLCQPCLPALVCVFYLFLCRLFAYIGLQLAPVSSQVKLGGGEATENVCKLGKCLQEQETLGY